MNILLIHTSDYLHHPQPSRQHAVFEILADRHNVHTLHFHISPERMVGRSTRLIVHEATLFRTMNPLWYYTLNAPYHYKVIKAVLKENQIDVIVTSNILASTAAIVAGKQFGVPVIFDVSDWFPDSAAAYIGNKWMKELVRKVVLAITKWNMKHSSKVLTVSPSLKKKLIRHGSPEPEVIMNGVNTELFRPMGKELAKFALGLDGYFVIGFAGAIEEWYDLESMIRAMPKLLKRYPDIKMLLVGGSLFTDDVSHLRALTYELDLGDKIRFTGFVPYERLHGYIAAMDVCAIPLIPKEWAEIALPNKFFEYDAMGKPILLTNIPDIINLGNEMYIYGDEESYLKAIDLFRMNPPKDRNEITHEHSWKNRAEEFERVMKGVIERS